MKYLIIILFLNFLKNINPQLVPCSSTQMQFFTDQGIDAEKTFCLDRGPVVEPLIHLLMGKSTIHEAYQKCRSFGGFLGGKPATGLQVTEYMNLMTRYVLLVSYPSTSKNGCYVITCHYFSSPGDEAGGRLLVLSKVQYFLQTPSEI